MNKGTFDNDDAGQRRYCGREKSRATQERERRSLGCIYPRAPLAPRKHILAQVRGGQTDPRAVAWLVGQLLSERYVE